ncbi:hypothetical protein IJ541_07260 [bacterium]|nr:hypothetical protein [bacterium]
MTKYDSKLIKESIKLHLLQPLGSIFDDDFMSKVYELDDEDPLKLIFIHGIELYYDKSNNSSKSVRLHEKALQLSVCIEYLLKIDYFDYRNWLETKKSEYLKSKSNTANKNAILGEIYTVGYIARMFVDSIIPVKTKAKKNIQTPDFKCLINNEEVIFEVNTQNMNDDEKDGIKKHKEESRKKYINSDKKGVFIDFYSVCPAGTNKKYRTTAENWISKISNIKAKSEQFKLNKMNILVINLFNEEMDLVDLIHFKPLFVSHQGCAFYSGNMFQAFYGKEGDKILEEYRGGYCPKMTFDGMFNREHSNNISAAILMMPYKTIIYENPNACVPLTYNVLFDLTKMHSFDLAHSFVRIPKTFYDKHKLSAEITRCRQKINSITINDCLG